MVGFFGVLHLMSRKLGRPCCERDGARVDMERGGLQTEAGGPRMGGASAISRTHWKWSCWVLHALSESVTTEHERASAV